MIVPTIHMNGTSKESLLRGWDKAYVAINDAMNALAEAGPNGRDFYPQGPEALAIAIKEHSARMTKLDEVRSELQELCNSIE